MPPPHGMHLINSDSPALATQGQGGIQPKLKSPINRKRSSSSTLHPGHYATTQFVPVPHHLNSDTLHFGLLCGAPAPTTSACSWWHVTFAMCHGFFGAGDYHFGGFDGASFDGDLSCVMVLVHRQVLWWSVPEPALVVDLSLLQVASCMGSSEQLHSD